MNRGKTLKEFEAELTADMSPEELADWNRCMSQARVWAKEYFATRRSTVSTVKDAVYQAIVSELADKSEVRQPSAIAKQATDAAMTVIRALVDGLDIRHLDDEYTTHRHQHPVLQAMATVVNRANQAMEDTADDGEILTVNRESFMALERAMQVLDELPDDRPGYTMGPAGKALWALRDA